MAVKLTYCYWIINTFILKQIPASVHLARYRNTQSENKFTNSVYNVSLHNNKQNKYMHPILTDKDLKKTT